MKIASNDCYQLWLSYTYRQVESSTLMTNTALSYNLELTFCPV